MSMRQVVLFVTSAWSFYHTWMFTQGQIPKNCYWLWHLSPHCNVTPERWHLRYWSLWISQKLNKKWFCRAINARISLGFSQLIFTASTWWGFFVRCSFWLQKSCTSELQPDLSNTNHLFIPHFLACYFQMEAIKTRFTVIWFPCWGLFCAHPHRKWAVAPPYEKTGI